MKKIITLVTAFVFVFTITACKNDDSVLQFGEATESCPITKPEDDLYAGFMYNMVFEGYPILDEENNTREHKMLTCVYYTDDESNPLERSTYIHYDTSLSVETTLTVTFLYSEDGNLLNEQYVLQKRDIHITIYKHYGGAEFELSAHQEIYRNIVLQDMDVYKDRFNTTGSYTKDIYKRLTEILKNESLN